MRNISHTPTTNVTKDNTIDICPMCNKRTKITQDKSMNKDEIIQWFSKFSGFLSSSIEKKIILH